MHDHWGEFGYPVNTLVARYLGLTKPKRKRIQAEQGGDDFLADMMRMFPEGGQ